MRHLLAKMPKAATDRLLIGVVVDNSNCMCALGLTCRVQLLSQSSVRYLLRNSTCSFLPSNGYTYLSCVYYIKHISFLVSGLSCNPPSYQTGHNTHKQRYPPNNIRTRQYCTHTNGPSNILTTSYVCTSKKTVSKCPQKHYDITLRLQQPTLIGHIYMYSS
jgi:hypothetical protein